MADEGHAPTVQRLADLQSYREELRQVLAGRTPTARWWHVYGPLSRAIIAHSLPAQPLENLLDAFTQDVHNPVYETREQLLDYCRLSANPIGRLLLHLHGVDDAESLQRADCICTALQLINFWQDCSIDLPRGRIYLPAQDTRRHGVAVEELYGCRDSRSSQALLRELCDWARAEMLQGADLALDLPGRVGWELRLVVQGGLRVLERMQRMDHRTLSQRPALGMTDALPMGWQALTMRRRAALARAPAA